MEKEIRFTIEEVTIENREVGEGDLAIKQEIIQGHFAVYNKPYILSKRYGLIEFIEKGAFDGVDISDVVALYNHDDDQLLGRTINSTGTLELSFDEKGGFFKVPKNDTQPSRDCYTNIQLKNIRGCSFAFTVEDENYEYDVPQADGSTATIRRIKKIKKLYDVGPVLNPAYLDTDVEACSKRAVEQRSKDNPPILSPDESYYLALKFR